MAAYYDPHFKCELGAAPAAAPRRSTRWGLAIAGAALVGCLAGAVLSSCPSATEFLTVTRASPVSVPSTSVAPRSDVVARAPTEHMAVQVTARPSTALASMPVAVQTETPAGLLTAERYIASNQFKVRDGAGPKFEQRWANRKSRLAFLPGFRFFTLMRRVNQDGSAFTGDDYNYVSLTVWQDKDAFNAWRNGDAFKEAHGGTDLFSFIKMIASSLLTTKGPPKPAFYEALIPVAAPANPTPTTDGWRSVAANGVDPLKGDCFVAMQRFTVRPGNEQMFEQRWASRTSGLQGQKGFKGFWLSRADTPLEDGANYVAMTVWDDAATFFAWRDVNDPKGKSQTGPVPDYLAGWPAQAYCEGVLMLESQLGI